MKRFIQFAFSLLMFGAITSLACQAMEKVVHPSLTAMGMVGLSVLAYTQQGDQQLYRSGISNEIWVDYIVKRFWKDNAWMKNFYSDDQYVVGGKTVHVPQPGSKPTANKLNAVGASLPLTATQRTDTDVNYDLGWYVTNPTVITEAEKQEISYQKLDSVLGDHVGVLNERIAEEHLILALNGVAGAGSIVQTSGSSMGVKVSGMTGTRSTLALADFKKAMVLLNLQNVPKEGRFAILDSNSLDELTSAMDTTQWNAFAQYFNAATGQMGRLYGIDIYERSDVAYATKPTLATDAVAALAWGTSVGAAHVAVNMVWQRDTIARAMGEVKMFEHIDNPLYAGSVYNAGIRFGGRRRFTADNGVIALRQTWLS